MNALTLWVPFKSRRLRNLSGLDPKTIALALAKVGRAPSGLTPTN